MTDSKRRSANAFPLKKGSAPSAAPSSVSAPAPARRPDPALRHVKLEAEALREKLQKSVIDNPQTAKKAALLISLWIEGKAKGKLKKAG